MINQPLAMLKRPGLLAGLAILLTALAVACGTSADPTVAPTVPQHRRFLPPRRPRNLRPPLPPPIPAPGLVQVPQQPRRPRLPRPRNPPFRRPLPLRDATPPSL